MTEHRLFLGLELRGSVAKPAPLPPSLKATLAILPLGSTPAIRELKLRTPPVEGVEWAESWPAEGVAFLRVPLLLPGARIKSLLRQALGGPAIAREVREFRLLVEAAQEALRAERSGSGARALMALADALEPLAPGTTMLEVQAKLRRALSAREVGVVGLSHYDSLIIAPADLEPSYIQTEIRGAYSSLASQPVAVVLRPLAALEALLPRLPPH